MPKKFNPSPKSKFQPTNSEKKKLAQKPPWKERESPENEESEDEGHVSDKRKRLDRGSIRSSPRYGSSPPTRLTMEQCWELGFGTALLYSLRTLVMVCQLEYPA